ADIGRPRARRLRVRVGLAESGVAAGPLLDLLELVADLLGEVRDAAVRVARQSGLDRHRGLQGHVELLLYRGQILAMTGRKVSPGNVPNLGDAGFKALGAIQSRVRRW